MKQIQLNDKSFALYLDEETILKRVKEVASQIHEDLHDKKPLFLVVLNGAFMFSSDLFKCFDFPCEISFVKLSSYQGTKSTEKVKRLIGLNEELKGRNIVIIEDIVDTGITMDRMLAEISLYQPESIRIATLLYKPEAFIKDFHIDYTGFEIPKDFIVGYGLDYDGLGRNYPEIYKIIE